jgi:membrane-bound serine protease (ClpP class)
VPGAEFAGAPTHPFVGLDEVAPAEPDVRVRRMPVQAVVALACAMALFCGAFSLWSLSDHPVVIRVRIDGVITPIKARHLHRAIEHAHQQNAAFVLMSIDTPGGLVTSMQSMVSDITNSPIPVVGYVEPPTAQATSAGAFLLLATDVAAMAPGTRVGAAHPVGADKNLEGAMAEKATNSLVALAKSLASRHHRSESYAESIVRKSSSFTAEEAKNEGAVEIIAPTQAALLATLDGYAVERGERKIALATRSAAVIEYPLAWYNRLLDIVADPTLASIFLSLGVLGILYELSSPGIGLAGIVGTICLVLALSALATLPLHIGGLALLLAGFVAIAVEIKSPAHGALALGGVVALIFGALVLVDETGYFGAAQRLDFRIFAPFVIVVTASFLLFARIAAKAQAAPFQTGMSAMHGAAGVAKSRVSPGGGMVLVGGALWQASADDVIEEGTPVIVEEASSHPTRLRVRAKEKGDA